MTEIILASSSPARKAQLQQLHLNFNTVSPDIDETPIDGESAGNYVERLAQQKAEAVLDKVSSDALVIGSDQTVFFDGKLSGKPLTKEKAATMLQQMQGKKVDFITAVAVVNNANKVGYSAIVPTSITFRQLTSAQIEKYLAMEDVLNCAGAIRFESLGIAVCQEFKSTDPSAITGLPLIATLDLLKKHGFDLF